ncbi:MAG: 16S rRNA (uracil(1498)-N(3))-methyltransferase [Flavobacteriaceae bacterium]|jgi:16S rRNA (uracil1498-N3)-methyltransferase|nr:16S rRNA (uracil(1498)-N(3))-methyltransferase [Flavobacteriaceae bacterium]
MQLFYNSELDTSIKTFNFSKDESRHIVKVLRKSTGDLLMITNGKGWIFEAEVIIPNHNKCVVSILKSTFETPRPYTIHLAVAPTKMNDRYEWFIEKATEIGVDIITPIICQNSERKIIKTERFEKILQSAMKQSLHCYLPSLAPAIRFSEFIKMPQEGATFIAHCEDGEKLKFKDQIEAKKSITILIGPEGDFSPKEIELALKHQYIPVSLGASRLRTETAGIVAGHTIQLCNE